MVWRKIHIIICMYGKLNGSNGGGSSGVGKCILHFTIHIVKFAIIMNSSIGFNVLLLLFSLWFVFVGELPSLKMRIKSVALRFFVSKKQIKPMPIRVFSPMTLFMHSKFHPLHRKHLSIISELNSNLYSFSYSLLFSF